MSRPLTSFIITFLLLSGIFIYSSSSLYDQTSPVRFLFLALALLVMIRKTKTMWPAFDRMNSSILIFFFVQLFSFFYAQNKQAVLPEIQNTFFILVTVLFLPQFLSQNKNSQNNILKSLVVIGFAWNAFGFYDYFKLAHNWRLPQNGSYVIASLFANKNFYSAALMITLPLIAFSFYVFNGFWKAASFVLVFLNLFMIINLQTRSVWLGTCIEILILFVCLCVSTIKQKNKTIDFLKQNRNWFYLSLGLLSLIILFEFATQQQADITNKISSAVNTSGAEITASSADERFFLWKKSFQMFKDHPVSGVGAGNWKVQINSYNISGSVAQYGNVNFVQPHNDFISALCENGIMGFVFYLSFLTALLFKITHRFNLKQGIDFKMVFMLCGLSGYLTYSFFEFPKVLPEHLALFLLLISFSLPLKEPGEIKIKRSNFPGFIIVFTLLIALVYNIGSIRANYLISQINKARFSENWSAILSASKKINTTFYEADMNGIPVKWFEGVANFNLGNIEEANKNFADAAAVYPYNLEVINNLATTFGLLGNNEKAKQLYRQALEISDAFDEARINYCVILFNEGKLNDCFNEIKKLSNLKVIQKNTAFILDVIDPGRKKNVRTPREIFRYLREAHRL